MRTALISGANRGIGQAVAQLLSEQGYKVLAGSRNLKDGETAVQGFANATAVALDLSEPVQQAKQVAAIVKAHGPIDILVNNAAVLHYGELLELDPKLWAESQRVNFQALVELTRALAPGMVERKWGRIVNVSSGLGSFASGLGSPAAYSITKASVNAFTVSLSRELPKSVKVNSVCPGWVATRMGGAGAPRSPRKGAESVAWAVTIPDTGPTGGFFRDGKKVDW